MRYDFPTDYETAPCYLVPINGALIPLVAGALKPFEERRSWNSDEDHEKAYNAFAALEAQMAACTMETFLQSNDRLYRLLDTAFNGRQYTVETTDPLVITPAIPDVPEPLDPPAGLVGMVDQLPGILDAGWFGIGGHKATLADIVNALRVGKTSTAESLLGQLNDILSAGGNIAQIGDLVSELFTGSVTALEEGGMLVLLAGGIAGNIAATGALSTQLAALELQLSRVVNTLDGGNLIPPTDNILTALRGTVAAGADRNVIDSETTVSDNIQTLIDNLSNEHADNADILAKLEEIRTLLV